MLSWILRNQKLRVLRMVLYVVFHAILVSWIMQMAISSLLNVFIFMETYWHIAARLLVTNN